MFWVGLGTVLGRLRVGFGLVLGGQNGQKIEIFGIVLDMLFETLILVEFCLIFDNFGRGDGEKHLFLHGGLLALLEGFGSKTRCLKIACDACYRRR